MNAATCFAGLPLGQAGAVLADPPWPFITYSAKGQAKAPDYACMSIADIKAMPVATLCAPDCSLTLWTTQAHVAIAMGVMAAWGFDFKTTGAWAKRSSTGACWQFGTGFILRSACEFYLVGTRGQPRRQSRKVRNLIVAPVREHSRKPDEIYEHIEELWPGPHLELFARHRRADWTQWGDELPVEVAP